MSIRVPPKKWKVGKLEDWKAGTKTCSPSQPSNLPISRSSNSYHTLAWGTWLIAAALPTLQTRNPLYLALIALAVSLVYNAVAQGRAEAQPWGAFVKLGFLVSLVAVPFNALGVHVGRYVLFRLPDWPVIGGPVTLEALLAGLCSALGLTTLLLIFAAFNVATGQARLLRWTPAFLFEAGLVASIAITFVPQMVRSAQAIREAQEVRGHRFRGVRDLLPLFVPLLTTGLERAVQLAESMEARGFPCSPSSQNPPTARQEIAYKLLTVLSLLGFITGSLAYTYFPDRKAVSLGVLVLSGGMLLLVFRAQGRRVRRSRYRREMWRPRDTMLAAMSGVVLLVTLGAKAVDRLAWIYSPYPPYSLWPPFNVLLGGALLLLAAPAVLSKGNRLNG